ncbi:MAG: hypothetical protein JWO48_3664 [Bryobacterales bacterium]|nr:hypothetical protein [Bryobacterales bacterium]
MLQSSHAAPSRGRAPPSPQIQFYSVQIMPLADGRISVGMSATICEAIHDDDFELVNMEVASARVATIEDALAVIRDAVAADAPN